MTPTSDVMDVHEDALMCEVQFRTFGLRRAAEGPLRTVRCVDDNSIIRSTLQEPSAGGILVVDGAASYRTALMGDNMAGIAMASGWAGVILLGCVRDSTLIDALDVHIKALGVCPRKSAKQGRGERDIPIEIGGTTFTPGHYLYSDADGLVVLPSRAS